MRCPNARRTLRACQDVLKAVLAENHLSGLLYHSLLAIHLMRNGCQVCCIEWQDNHADGPLLGIVSIAGAVFVLYLAWESLNPAPPEPKVESSTLSSRTSLRFGAPLITLSRTNGFRVIHVFIGWVTSSENGLKHRPNQNRNQNNGEKLKEMGERRSGIGF